MLAAGGTCPSRSGGSPTIGTKPRPVILRLEAARGGNDAYEGLATGLPQLVFGCQATGERTWPGPQWIIFTGLSAADSAGFGRLEAVHPDDRQATMAAWATA